MLRTSAAPSVNTWTGKGRKDLGLVSPTAGCNGTGPYMSHSHRIPRSLSCSSASGREADETVGLCWAPGPATTTGSHLCACQHHTVPESLTLWTELISKLYGKLWKVPEEELVFRSMPDISLGGKMVTCKTTSSKNTHSNFAQLHTAVKPSLVFWALNQSVE